MKYAFRSLEMYAPWINHVYLVTNGQAPPSWLNLSNKDISIVHHDQFYRNLSHLPVFNSNAIEANIHLIPGLSEKFIYLNDDFALTSQVCPSDFLTKEGDYIIYRSNENFCNTHMNVSCHSEMLGDGNCDHICNSKDCQEDGGDCPHEASYKIFNSFEDLNKSTRGSWEASIDYLNILFNKKLGPNRRYNFPHSPMLVEKKIMLGNVSDI